MENNLHQAPAKPEVICSTLRAVPEETHPWFPDLEALFSDPRSRLIDSLVKNDLYVLLKKKGIEVQSTSVNGHGTSQVIANPTCIVRPDPFYSGRDCQFRLP